MVKTTTTQEPKPVYRQSLISKYFRCPRMFWLAQDYEANIGSGTQRLLDNGNIFEGLVLGFKDDKDKAELLKGKRSNTIAKLAAHAEYVKPIFEGQEGQAYVRQSVDLGQFEISGENDYLGYIDEDELFDRILEVKNREPIGKAIWDLKYTAGIMQVWDFKNAKEDYIQAVVYCYIHYRLFGELLPFCYIVVENNNFERPIIRLIVMKVELSDFSDFLEPLLFKIHNDHFYKPEASKLTCLGGLGESACWYLEYCEHGRLVTGGRREFKFKEFRSNMFLTEEDKKSFFE